MSDKDNVVTLCARLYEAKAFNADTEYGRFTACGTRCGNIDFAGPSTGTYPLSPDEVLALIVMLQRARDDVLENSEPLNDPRIVERTPR